MDVGEHFHVPADLSSGTNPLYSLEGGGWCSAVVPSVSGIEPENPLASHVYRPISVQFIVIEEKAVHAYMLIVDKRC